MRTTTPAFERYFNLLVSRGLPMIMETAGGHKVALVAMKDADEAVRIMRSCPTAYRAVMAPTMDTPGFSVRTFSRPESRVESWRDAESLIDGTPPKPAKRPLAFRR